MSGMQYEECTHLLLYDERHREPLGKYNTTVKEGDAYILVFNKISLMRLNVLLVAKYKKVLIGRNYT